MSVKKKRTIGPCRGVTWLYYVVLLWSRDFFPPLYLDPRFRPLLLKYISIYCNISISSKIFQESVLRWPVRYVMCASNTLSVYILSAKTTGVLEVFFSIWILSFCSATPWFLFWLQSLCLLPEGEMWVFCQRFDGMLTNSCGLCF